MLKNNRNMYIDVYKGLLMTLVVIGHLFIFDYDSKTLVLIYSFHMPAFLIIGGILSNIKSSDTPINIIKKRFMSCIIPYIIFNIISFILFSQNVNRIECIKTIILGIGKPDSAINLPTWFLTFYFTIMTIYDLIKLYSIKTSKNKKKREMKTIGLVCICFIIGFFTHSFFRKVMWPPYNIQQALYCMPFVCMGDKISENITTIKNKIHILSKDKNKMALYLISALIITITIIYIWFKLSIKNGRIDMNARDYKNKILFYINAILGFTWFSLLVYIISKIHYINNIFSYIGKESLYVLGYHITSSIFIVNYINAILVGPILYTILNTKILCILYYTTLEISISLLLGYIHKTICHKKK